MAPTRIRRVFGNRMPTGQESASDQQDFLRAAADMGGKRASGYDIFEDYYAGEHRTILLDRARRYLQASGFRFAENFCETVVDVHRRRLRVTGFVVDGNDAASDWLTEHWWSRGRLNGLQGTVHAKTLILGDGIVITDWDHRRNRPRPCWNHPRNVKPVYDENGELLYLVKRWETTRTSPQNPRGLSITRLNLYYPDRVEKWYTPTTGAGSMWAPYRDPDDVNAQGADVWPIPWTKTGQIGGEPLGIPAVHFRNNALGDDFGRSLLRGVIPQNDQLNKQLLDLFGVMDAQGWKQRYASGIDNPDGLNVAIGEWVTTTREGARFGEFDAEDPVPLQEIIEGTLKRISARSATPLYDLIVGEFPSGEALKTADGACVAAAEDRHVEFGQSWEDKAHINWRLADAFGNDAPPYDPDATIDVQWEPAATRDDLGEVTVLGVEVEQFGVSRTTALRRRGYNPDDEARLRAEEEAADPAPPPPPPPPGGQLPDDHPAPEPDPAPRPS